MTSTQPTRPGVPGDGSVIAVSVHGPAGVLDLVVPAAATAVDLGREYAAQSGWPGLPLLQSPLGELLTADRSLAELGVESGDLLVATAAVSRPRPAGGDRLAEASAGDGRPVLAPVVVRVLVVVAAAVAGLAGWSAAHLGDGWRGVVVGLLLGAGLLAALPIGRHATERAAAAPVFGGAAAFAAVWAPGTHLLPAVVAVTALAAAVVAAVGRAAAGRAEALEVWVVGGLVVFVVAGAASALGWDPRVAWTLLLVLAVLAARFVPGLAVDVPDEALLEIDRLAVTAWSAHDRPRAGRRRIVVPRAAMADLVDSASRTVTAATAVVLAVVVVAAPLLLREATLDLDRIGARCLLAFGGATLLLTARGYRHRGARSLLRASGLAAWVPLVGSLAGSVAAPAGVGLAAASVALALAVLGAAVATGRGWRSAWWSRRAEVAEAWCGSFALASAVVASGLFRALWEMTS